MDRSTENLRGWFRSVQAVIPELYNAASAMCGAAAAAEEALIEALVEVWSQDLAAGVGVRERLRLSLRREALAAMDGADPSAASWPGLRPALPEDALMRLAAQEPLALQRMILLRYGCALPARQIARFVGGTPVETRAALADFEARCRRRLPRAQRGRVGASIAREARRALSKAAPEMPSPERVYRNFEAAAMDAESSMPRLGRVAGRAAVLLMALLCAVMFWIFAVISTPIL